jgi:hypothetical protein
VLEEAVDLLSCESPSTAGELGGGPGSVDDDVADGEVAKEGEAIDVGEAQCATDLDRLGLVREDSADGGDLALDADDQFGLVTATDPEDRATLKQETADAFDANLAPVVLRVDNGDPARSDGDMVDIRAAAAGHPAVM